MAKSSCHKDPTLSYAVSAAAAAATADLSVCRLLHAGVSFFGALAEGASFKGANLTTADLESGNFEEADFTDAVLEGAFMNNAQLKVRCKQTGASVAAAAAVFWHCAGVNDQCRSVCVSSGPTARQSGTAATAAKYTWDAVFVRSCAAWLQHRAAAANLVFSTSHTTSVIVLCCFTTGCNNHKHGLD